MLTPHVLCTALQGVSLKPILENPETATVKEAALSSFPRCAHKGMPEYGARGSANGADNTCLEVERTDFTWMGYTMRTARYRYTEWVVSEAQHSTAQHSTAQRSTPRHSQRSRLALVDTRPPSSGLCVGQLLCIPPPPCDSISPAVKPRHQHQRTVWIRRVLSRVLVFLC